jgi:hypothetical protein
MSKESLPTTWHLDKKSDSQLLDIAEHRIWCHYMKATLIWKFSRFFRRNAYLRSKFYADWYAMAALRELRKRKGL